MDNKVADWFKQHFSFSSFRGLSAREPFDQDSSEPKSNFVYADDISRSSNEDIFVSGAYLQEYYSSLGHENAEVGKFLMESAAPLSSRGSIKVLDAGCGPTVLYWGVYIPHPMELHAFDINPVSVAVNQRRIAEVQCGVADDGLIEAAEHAIKNLGVNSTPRFLLADKARQVASIKVADLTNKWPYAASQFDFIFSCFALEQLPTWDQFDQAVIEARRVLKDDGRMAVVLGANSSHWNCDQQKFETLLVTPKKVRERLDACDLDVIELREIQSADTSWRDQGYSSLLLVRVQKRSRQIV